MFWLEAGSWKLTAVYYHATARDARLRLRQFRHVHFAHAVAQRPQGARRARVTGGADDRLADAQHVGGMGLRRIDVHDVDADALETARIDPRRIAQDAVRVEGGDRRLQMETSTRPNALDRVPERRELGGELTGPVLVRSSREPNVERPSEPEHVSAVECSRWADRSKRPVLREDLRHRLALLPARFRAGARDDGDLVDDNRHVLHEDRIREIGRGGDVHERASERPQRLLVLVVLRRRDIDVNRHARLVRQLAAREALGNGARHGNAHFTEGLRPSDSPTLARGPRPARSRGSLAPLVRALQV